MVRDTNDVAACFHLAKPRQIYSSWPADPHNERWRTMSTTLCLRCTPDEMGLLEAFMTRDRGEQLTHAMQISLVPTLVASTRLRTYFRTQSGGHGLCYPTSEVGDQVWLVHGSTVPFVLRYVRLDANVEENILRPSRAYVMNGETGLPIAVRRDFVPEVKPAGHYQLIGDCYLDGFMDG
jgi:hypothetical protein